MSGVHEDRPLDAWLRDEAGKALLSDGDEMRHRRLHEAARSIQASMSAISSIGRQLGAAESVGRELLRGDIAAATRLAEEYRDRYRAG